MRSAPEYAESAELALTAAEAVVARVGWANLTPTDRHNIDHHHSRASVFATLALAAATHRPVVR